VLHLQEAFAMLTFLVDETQAEFVSQSTVAIIRQSKSGLINDNSVKSAKLSRGSDPHLQRTLHKL
jgi:hypothetical protein